jgi:hypothetical protein
VLTGDARVLDRRKANHAHVGTLSV